MTQTVLHTVPPLVHGGPDALGVPRFDFSTNSNACGPCPQAVAALAACDAARYPDPHYTALRQQLATFHAVEPWRVVLAGSASEFIYRITAWVAQQAMTAGRKRGAALLKTVCVPVHAYGDYAQAALAWGLTVVTQGNAALQWQADPSSPMGQSLSEFGDVNEGADAVTRVLDCAYAPLRLNDSSAWSDTVRHTLWQLWTPNKALGLTGIRAAYAIAPLDAQAAVEALNRLCPSWPVGAHGVALLQCWVQPEVQSWLTQSRVTLTQWKARQINLLEGLGWTCLPSDTNFFCARPLGDATDGDPGPNPDLSLEFGAALAGLRQQGIKLRDATSFGLPGQVRVSVQPPVAQDALARAWQSLELNKKDTV